MRDNCWNEPQLHDFHGYLYTVNNGCMDVEGFIDSEYGAETARRLMIRSRIEYDHEEAKKYYASIGLKKGYFDWEDYYDRWTLLTPMNMEEGKSYPLVFWLHGGGNSIEAEENMTGFTDMAAKEGFMLACPQNTSPDKVLQIIERVAELYPLDRGRVYLCGFSQGGAQSHGAYFRNPEKFAACVTTGNDIWRPWDNFQVDYTDEEIENTRRLRVPLMQFCGQVEPFPYAPLNSWSPRRPPKQKPWGRPDTFDHPGKNDDLDPTRIHDLSKGKFDAVFGKANEHKWRMATQYEPAEGEDVTDFGMKRVNFRMDLLDCEPRDVETCRGFLTEHQDTVHRVVGIYGDYEAVEYHYGYRHYTVGINDRQGHEVYRFVCVQNTPHWPQLSMGELGWAFLKRFSRNVETGELIITEEE